MQRSFNFDAMALESLQKSTQDYNSLTMAYSYLVYTYFARGSIDNTRNTFSQSLPFSLSLINVIAFSCVIEKNMATHHEKKYPSNEIPLLKPHVSLFRTFSSILLR